MTGPWELSPDAPIWLREVVAAAIVFLADALLPAGATVQLLLQALAILSAAEHELELYETCETTASCPTPRDEITASRRQSATLNPVNSRTTPR